MKSGKKVKNGSVFKGFGIIFWVAFLSSSALYGKGYSGFHGRVLQEGLINCFEEGLRNNKGNPVYCETSAVVFDRKRLLIASDRGIPGQGRSSFFGVGYHYPFSKHVLRPDFYLKSPILQSARKFESVTVTPDGKHIIAATSFSYLPASAKSSKPYYNLIAWPEGEPGKAYRLAESKANGVESSFRIYRALRRWIKTPYLKVEGLAAIPGNKLLLGIREEGKTQEDFKYVTKIFAVSYEVKNGKIKIKEDWDLTYDYNLNRLGVTKDKIGLSSLEYDWERKILYLLSSLEKGKEGDKVLGAYLWTLTLEDLFGNRSPKPVLNRRGKPLFLNRKGEGLAVLGKGRLFIIHDEDRELRFGRKPHQAPYSIIAIR